MLRFASLLASAALLSASTLAASASTLNPLADGISLSVNNTVLTTTNAAFDGTTGVLSFSDLTSTYTFAEVNVPSLVDGLSVTRVCATANVNGCASSVVSVSDAKVLGGTLQASATVRATVQATAVAGVSNVVFSNNTIALGTQSALVGYPAGSNSPVPEPGTLGLMATGLVGVAGVLRRRYSL